MVTLPSAHSLSHCRCRTAGTSIQHTPVSTPEGARDPHGMGRAHLEHACSGWDILHRGAERWQPPLAVPGHRETEIEADLSLRHRRPRTRHIHVPHYAVQRGRIGPACHLERRPSRLLSPLTYPEGRGFRGSNPPPIDLHNFFLNSVFAKYRNTVQALLLLTKS